MSDLCSKCGAPIVTSYDVPAPHYARLVCTGDIPHHQSWVGRPWTYERACRFVMFFGKHSGSTLEAIAKEHRDYLEWMAETLEPSKAPCMAARRYLQGPP